jgi:hypothetical protein
LAGSVLLKWTEEKKPEGRKVEARNQQAEQGVCMRDFDKPIKRLAIPKLITQSTFVASPTFPHLSGDDSALLVVLVVLAIVIAVTSTTGTTSFLTLEYAVRSRVLFPHTT